MAQRLATVLIRHGVPTFFSPQNIIGAQQWQNEILSALQRLCVLATIPYHTQIYYQGEPRKEQICYRLP